MGLDDLLAALNQPKSIKQHPNWSAFCEKKVPVMVSFLYENKNGEEAYFDRLPIIKFNLEKMWLIAEGSQGDPLRFDIFKISNCKNAETGERVQDFFVELTDMWRDTFNPAEAND